MRVVVVGAGAVADALGAFLAGRSLTCTVMPAEHVAGNAVVRQADWIIEAAGEDVHSKRAALAAVAAASRGDCLVSSDASVHTRAELLEGAAASFMARHAVAHFFFPLDRLALVEWVAASGEGVVPMAVDAQERLRHVLVAGLRRQVVECKDRPGYVANRLGFAALAQAMALADEYGLSPARADSALTRVLGWPRTAAFGTVDLIVPSLFAKLSQALADRLAQDDPLAQALPRALAWIQRLERFPAGAFYRRSQKGRPPLVIDFQDGVYRAPSTEPLTDHEETYAGHVRSWVSDYLTTVAGQTGLSAEQVWGVMAGSYGWAVPENHMGQA